MIEANSNDFAEHVSGPGPVLVDFWAPWCAPCRAMLPQLEAYSAQPDAAKVVKVNADEAGDVAARYGVQSLPTLIVFRDGQPVAQRSGMLAQRQIAKLVQSA